MTNRYLAAFISFVKNNLLKSTPSKILFENIGLTVEIPSKFRLLNKRQINRRNKRATKNSNKTNLLLTNETIQQRIFIAQKSKKKIIMGTVTDFAVYKTDDWHQHNYDRERRLVNSIEKRYAMYSRVRLETHSIHEEIDDVDFNRLEIIIRTPTRIILHYYIYCTLYKGDDVVITALFDSEDSGEQILASLHASKFSGK